MCTEVRATYMWVTAELYVHILFLKPSNGKSNEEKLQSLF